MHTDDLIAALVNDHRPVDRGAINRAMLVATAAAFLWALVAVIGTIGLRPDWATALGSGAFDVKALFVLSTLILAGIAVRRLAAPIADGRGLLIPLAVPAAVVWVVAARDMGAMPTAEWPTYLMGTTWYFCLILVPAFAVLPYLLITTVCRRRGAPTDLASFGAATGVLSGAIVASVYAFHCFDDAAGFVACWYVAALVLSAALGALAAPYVARW